MGFKVEQINVKTREVNRNRDGSSGALSAWELHQNPGREAPALGPFNSSVGDYYMCCQD